MRPPKMTDKVVCPYCTCVTTRRHVLVCKQQDNYTGTPVGDVYALPLYSPAYTVALVTDEEDNKWTFVAQGEVPTDKMTYYVLGMLAEVQMTENRGITITLADMEGFHTVEVVYMTEGYKVPAEAFQV